jgi:hypothetical protein
VSGQSIIERWRSRKGESSCAGTGIIRREGKAVETKANRNSIGVQEHPFMHLVATPEERARILAAGRPFDAEAWLRDAVPATPEEVADLEEFLREREEQRRYSLQRQEELLAELGE